MASALATADLLSTRPFSNIVPTLARWQHRRYKHRNVTYLDIYHFVVKYFNIVNKYIFHLEDYFQSGRFAPMSSVNIKLQLSYCFSGWMFVPDPSGWRVVETERRPDYSRMLLVAPDVDLEMCWTRVDRSTSGKLYFTRFESQNFNFISIKQL